MCPSLPTLAAVDPLKLLLPEPWRALPYFSKLDGLKGVPVINIHMCAPWHAHGCLFLPRFLPGKPAAQCCYYWWSQPRHVRPLLLGRLALKKITKGAWVRAAGLTGS